MPWFRKFKRNRKMLTKRKKSGKTHVHKTLRTKK